MTISQLLGHIGGQSHDVVTPETGHRLFVIVRRCLIWAVITVVASWIISSHVFAEEIKAAPKPGPVVDEKFTAPVPETTPVVTPMPGVTPTPEATPTQATPSQVTGCTPASCYDYGNPNCVVEYAPACDVGPEGRYWFQADYLLWWTKGSRVVPLVSNGTIGEPGVQVLYGNDRYDLGSRSNFGFEMGMWFDHGRTFGVALEGFTLGEAGESRSFSSDGSTVLAQPFYNVESGANSSILFAGPDGNYTLLGAMDPRHSEYFQSLALTFRLNLLCNGCGCGGWGAGIGTCGDTCTDGGCGSCSDFGCRSSRTRAGFFAQGFQERFRPDSWRVDFVTGWRTCRLNEWTTINGTTTRSDNAFFINSWDQFKSQNEFNGGDLGLLAQFYKGRWSLDVLAKVGLGNQNQTVRIRGQTVITAPVGGTSTTYEGGLFALGSNIGHYDRDKFVAIPQIGLELGYQINGNLRAKFGYNFIYWANVVRSSEQISSQIDPNQIPPSSSSSATQPAFSWNDSDYWAQGLNFGLEARF